MAAEGRDPDQFSARMILAVTEAMTFQEATHEDPEIARLKAAAGIDPLDLSTL